MNIDNNHDKKEIIEHDIKNIIKCSKEYEVDFESPLRKLDINTCVQIIWHLDLDADVYGHPTRLVSQLMKFLMMNNIIPTDYYKKLGYGLYSDVKDIGHEFEFGNVYEIPQQCFAATSWNVVTELPESVEIIDQGAFERAELVGIKLPDSLKVIDRSVFWNASFKDKNLVIPHNVEEVGNFAFDGANIETLEILSPNMSLSPIVFGSFINKSQKPQLKTIYAPKNSCADLKDSLSYISEKLGTEIVYK